MAESVYKIIELVGTSDESWEKAAAVPPCRGVPQSLRDLRIAELAELDADRERSSEGLPSKGRLLFKYEVATPDPLSQLVRYVRSPERICRTSCRRTTPTISH
jgi:flavin-binding protein dodecin